MIQFMAFTRNHVLAAKNTPAIKENKLSAEGVISSNLICPRWIRKP